MYFFVFILRLCTRFREKRKNLRINNFRHLCTKLLCLFKVVDAMKSQIRQLLKISFTLGYNTIIVKSNTFYN